MSNKSWWYGFRSCLTLMIRLQVIHSNFTEDIDSFSNYVTHYSLSHLTHHWVKHCFKHCFKDICICADDGQGFVFHAYMWHKIFLTAQLICLYAHYCPSAHLSLSLLESHDPIKPSLVDHRVDPNMPGVTWDVSDQTVMDGWEACLFTLYWWQSYKGLSSCYSETWLKYLQSPAGG